MIKILIADDDPDVAVVLATYFGEVEKKYEVATAFSKSELLEKIALWLPELIILDVWFGKANGRILCKFIKSNFLQVKVILISATAQLLENQKECLANGCVEKPFDLVHIAKTVERVIAAS